MLLQRSTPWCCLLVLAMDASGNARQESMEHVSVTARRSQSATDRPPSPLNRPLNPGSASVPVSNLADLLQTQPGLAYAGQGGLLQTVSIRGISGQRVANYFGDLPLQSERRAGTSSSFVDPLMLETVEVVRGPASVYYGSGAVAGVLQLQPARPKGLEWQLQWGSEGNENLQYLGYGKRGFSLAVSRRAAADSEAADGSELHTRFEQRNAQLSWDFDLAGRSFTFNTLYSEGEDIGKSNSLYPDQRVTEYPRESHWLGQLSGELSDSLSGSVYYHQQTLETLVYRPGEGIKAVENSAMDWGWRLDFSDASVPLRAGMEYFGRRNVEAEEFEVPDGHAPLPTQKTLDADQDGVDLYLESVQHVARLELAGGLRWSFLSQQAQGFETEREQAPSLFLRGTLPATAALEFSLEFASGVRFPNLSERFFSGTTGRGQVLGNPALDPEQTLSADLGMRWQQPRSALEFHVYAMQIDDYIERIDLAPGLRSFANLRQGDITGAEAAWRFSVSDSLVLRGGAHYLEGEDESGSALTDIAAPRISAGVEYATSDWRTSLDYEHRFEKSAVAPREQPFDRARLLSASLGRSWPQGWRVSIWGRNLLNETYRLSSDAIAPLGVQRSLGISLSWSEPEF